MHNSIKIPVSVGELIDKITILHIKSIHSDSQYVISELSELTQIAKDHGVYRKNYIDRLYEVNCSLWEVEDELRKLELHGIFDSKFINLARSVYKLNDERACIKRDINDETRSMYREIKIY